MAKNNGKEGSPVDVYILSIGKEDSWKGTPLDVEEELIKSEPTTTASSAVSSDAGSTPEKKSKNEDKETASKVKDTLVTEKHKAKNLNKSPFPKVSPPTRKELEVFTENKKASSLPPPPLASPLVAPNLGEALSPKQSHSLKGSHILENGGIGREEVPAAAVVSQPPPSSPPPAGQISVAEKESVGGGGNGARKELEDAIQRIEAHIKVHILLKFRINCFISH